MIAIDFNPDTQVAKLSFTLPVTAGADVPVRITFSPTPNEVTAIQLGLVSDLAAPATLAYTDTFSAENANVWEALLDANDTRLLTALSGKTTLQVVIALVCTLDGARLVNTNLRLTVQPPVFTGPVSTIGGPTYYTAAEVNALIATGGGSTSLTVDKFLPLVTGTTGGAGPLKGVNCAAAGFVTGQIIWFLDSTNTVWRYLLADVGALPANADPFTILPLTPFGTRFWQLLSVHTISGTYDNDSRSISFLGQTVIADKFSGDGRYLTNLQASTLTGAMSPGVTIDAARLTSGILAPGRFGLLNAIPDLDYAFSSDTFAAGNAGLYTISLTAARSYALPPVSAFLAGAFYRVFDQAGVVTSTQTLTVTANGSDTINGASSLTLSIRWGVLVLRSLGGGKWQGWIEGGRLNIATVEVDLGSSAVDSGVFDITGLNGLTTNAAVIISQGNGPYTGKGTLDDDSEFDALEVTAYCLNSTTIRAHWASQTGVVTGNFKFNYLV